MLARMPADGMSLAQEEMRQKEAQIAALRAHQSGGRRALLHDLASSVASSVADCERRMAEEV